jgi:hypothetical protein
MLQASGQIGKELLHGTREDVSIMLHLRKSFSGLPSVLHGARDTLGDENAVTLREVARGASVALLAVLAAGASLSVLHSVDAAHATVRLDELALSGNEGGTGRFGCAGQQTSHHDSAGTEGQTLDDVSNILDTTIGNAGHAEASSKGTHAVDTSSLGSANGHDFLRDTGASTAHTNTKTINTSGNEGGGLFPRDNVSADHVELRELLLDPLEHLNLVHAVTLAAVQDDNVEAGIYELSQANLILRPGSDSSSTDKLLGIREFRSQGVVHVLGQIGARDHGDQVAVLVDDRQLALLRLGEDLVCLLQRYASLGGDEVLVHDIGHGLLVVVLELDVTVRDDTEQLGSELPRFCNEALLANLPGLRSLGKKV